jgi:predicted kinase
VIPVPDGSLVVLVGPAGSGKTALARTAWPEPGYVISSDQLRAIIGGYEGSQDPDVTRAVFQVVHELARLRLARGLTTVVDATNSGRGARATLLGIARTADAPAVAVVVLPPLDICLARNAQRARVVPEDVVRRQHAAVSQAAPGLTAEGFTAVILAPPMRPVAT